METPREHELHAILTHGTRSPRAVARSQEKALRTRRAATIVIMLMVEGVFTSAGEHLFTVVHARIYHVEDQDLSRAKPRKPVEEPVMMHIRT